ncbi:MAG: hypothetical protein GY861_23315 [bacterium]|nr:hypothetical protein [bacterium]
MEREILSLKVSEPLTDEEQEEAFKGKYSWKIKSAIRIVSMLPHRDISINKDDITNIKIYLGELERTPVCLIKSQ